MTVSRLAFLGPVGTYSELAARRYQTQRMPAAEAIAYPTIPLALQAAREPHTWAIVPVENALQGSVTLTLDTLWDLLPPCTLPDVPELQIQAALELPIRHALLGQDWGQIRAVHSHPQALAQCRDWLATHLPQAVAVPTASTSEGAIAARESPQVAAIASPHAADLYGLRVLATEIDDRPENRTRFWVLGKTPPTVTGTHTSLAFSTRRNAPGALLAPLQVFADRHLNLSRIESRPTRRSLGDYVFFLDIEAPGNHPAMAEALAVLPEIVETLKIFGSYTIGDR
ncbi:MAG: prephenate dehydratase [Pseudanabaenaceae cyanobacterium]